MKQSVLSLLLKSRNFIKDLGAFKVSLWSCSLYDGFEIQENITNMHCSNMKIMKYKTIKI